MFFSSFGSFGVIRTRSVRLELGDARVQAGQLLAREVGHVGVGGELLGLPLLVEDALVDAEGLDRLLQISESALVWVR